MDRVKELQKVADKADATMDKELFNFYKSALKDLKKETKKFVDEIEPLTFSKKVENARKLEISKKIDDIIKGVGDNAQTSVLSHIRSSALDGYMGVFFDLEGKTKMALDFNMLNEKFIDKLVHKKTVGKDFVQRIDRNTTKLAKVVKQELLQGAIDGKGYKAIAKNIAEQTEEGYKSSLRIARTEGHRVQTEATQGAYEEAQDMGIQLQKQWLSSLDGSTRDEHADLDGQTVGIDEDFEIDGMSAPGPGLFGDPAMDINCRCTTITIVEGISPSLRKDNETKEVIEYKNYNEWKENKS